MTGFDAAFVRAPLVAILRGVRPDEVADVVGALESAGLRLVEVPLNSPDPLGSLRALARRGGPSIFGAGTVLTPDEADAVADAGGRFIVSPNTDAAVIDRALGRGLEVLPGFATPSEAFAALTAGARRLKLFPAATFGPGYLKQIGAVLPAEAQVIPVGGVGPADMVAWRAAGAAGFGLGSELYRPGMDVIEVERRARTAMSALVEAMLA